uniref:Uncharacterized protein n=1 Tax=Cacopsylla melanoneura TaxID=428564 RepID=A0A8D8Z1A4_9HEMI
MFISLRVKGQVLCTDNIIYNYLRVKGQVASSYCILPIIIKFRNFTKQKCPETPLGITVAFPSRHGPENPNGVSIRPFIQTLEIPIPNGVSWLNGAEPDFWRSD